MEQLAFRPAVPGDEELILQMIQELARYEELEHQVVADCQTLHHWIFEKGGAQVLFAMVNGQEVGFALYFYNFSTFLGRENLYLEDLYVTPAWRGRGIGLRLIRRVAGQAVQEGCRRLDWVCLDWNRPSREFYEKLGAHAMPWWVGYRAENEALIQLAGDKGEKNNGN